MLLAILVGTLAIVVGFIVWRNIRLQSQNSQELWKDSCMMLQRRTLLTSPVQSSHTLPITRNLNPPSKALSALNMASHSPSRKTPIMPTSFSFQQRQGTYSPLRETSGDGMNGMLMGVLVAEVLSHDASPHEKPSDYSCGGSVTSNNDFTGNNGSFGGAGSSGSFD